MKNVNEIELPGNAIIRIKGQDCWSVPSHTAGHAPHKVCWNRDERIWECSCKNGQEMATRGQSARCYAVNAVMISVLANKQDEPKVESKPAPARERGSLYRAEIKMVNGIPMR